jgi:hypothetical protein
VSADALPASRTMTVVRVVLVVGGLALLALGGLVLLLDVPPRRYLGIALWFAGAIVVHDAVIAPAVVLVASLLRRTGRRMPGGVLVIIQAAIVVLAIVTGLVVPEILKKEIGSANPTILPLDYLPNLILLYGVVAAAAGIAIAVYLAVRARRQNARPRSSKV